MQNAKDMKAQVYLLKKEIDQMSVREGFIRSQIQKHVMKEEVLK